MYTTPLLLRQAAAIIVFSISSFYGIILLCERSTSSELSLLKFSNQRCLEKLRLRSVAGLTMADGCSDLTDVKGLVHLKTLVSALHQM